MHRARSGFLSCLLACSIALSPAFAHADPLHPSQEQSERAHQLFQQSKPLQDAKKFSDAERLLLEAWELHHSPDIAANLGLAEAALGKHRSAAEHLSFAIRNIMASATTEQRNKIKKALELVKHEIATVRVIVEPSGADVSVDGQAIGKAPFDDDVFVEPGERRFEATASGYAAKAESLAAKKGEVHSLILKLERPGETTAGVNPNPGAPNSPAETPQTLQGDTNNSSSNTGAGISTKTVVMIAEAGVAAIGLGVGIGFLLAKNSAADDRDKLRDQAVDQVGQNGCSSKPDTQVCVDLRDADDRLKRDRTLSTVGFVGFGVGLAALGATYFLWPERQGARVGFDPLRRSIVVSGSF